MSSLLPPGYFPFGIRFSKISAREFFVVFYKAAANHHLETAQQPVVLVVPHTPLAQFRKTLQARFRKPVTLLQLAANQLGIAHQQSRHKVGLSHPALPRQKNLLAFFELPPTLSTHPPTHNRTVEGSSPSGPTIFYSFQKVITR